ncbi:MAG: hypothetical protein AAFR26_15160 [Cyanobacteria bacterium J06626_4]
MGEGGAEPNSCDRDAIFGATLLSGLAAAGCAAIARHLPLARTATFSIAIA